MALPFERICRTGRCGNVERRCLILGPPLQKTINLGNKNQFARPIENEILRLMTGKQLGGLKYPPKLLVKENGLRWPLCWACIVRSMVSIAYAESHLIFRTRVSKECIYRERSGQLLERFHDVHLLTNPVWVAPVAISKLWQVLNGPAGVDKDHL